MRGHKYTKPTLWTETMKNFKMKQQKMNHTLMKITGKKTFLPLTRVIHVISTQPFYFNDNEILDLVRKKRRRRI